MYKRQVSDAPSPLKADLATADKAAAKEKMKGIQEQMQAKVAERKNKRKLSISQPRTEQLEE